MLQDRKIRLEQDMAFEESLRVDKRKDAITEVGVTNETILQ